MSTTRTIEADGIEFATEAFGDPKDPALLMVMGAMASMLWWPDGLCRRLADAGRYVIRYDNRDTGLSTIYEPGAPSYSMEDMADDTVRVLDGYGLRTAHIVGMSLGGAIAQIAAFRHPERFLSLTVLSSSAVGVDTDHLPQMTEAYIQHAAEGESVDWSDDSQVIDYLVKDARMIASTKHPHDASAARAFIERDVARAKSFASATNHFIVRAKQDWSGRLEALDMPVLVIHGTSDPISPVEHGKALADAAPHGRLVTIEGGGHEQHPADWDIFVEAIAGHTAAR